MTDESFVAAPTGPNTGAHVLTHANAGSVAIWLVLAVMVAGGVAGVSGFASARNVDQLLIQGAVLGIVAIGQTVLVATGGMDLSVGALIGLVVVLLAGLLGPEGSLAAALVLMLGVGGAVGLLNGFLVVRLRVDPIIGTLGMLSILMGLTFVYTDRTLGPVPNSLLPLAAAKIGPLPLPFIILCVVAIGSWVLLNRTVLGAHLRASGSDRAGAARAGVSTGRVRGLAYAWCAVVAAIAGLVLAARLGTGYPRAGLGLELDSVIAVALGGTALSGGMSSIAGTLGAVYVLTVLTNLLNLVGVQSYAQEGFRGVLIVLAMAVYVQASERDRA